MYDFKVKWCPICDQGWIEILKEIPTGQLVCGCDECESGWDTPDSINRSNSTWCVYNKECCYPSAEEIEKNGWSKYVLK